MSKTLRTFKGEKYKPSTHNQKKKLAKTKFMGFTSGAHSRKEGDEAPLKGVDFIKYGYPNSFYPKHIYLAKKRIYG